MRKIILFVHIILFLTCTSSLLLHGQTHNDTLQNINNQLTTYTTGYVTEKTYLQFDKPYYATGDTIYFKAYVTLGARHKLSALSGILYADFIGPAGKISQSIKLPIIAGTAWGDFVIADTLKGGNYRVRAYTNWMRNEGDESLFIMEIPVGTAGIKKIPEGGIIDNSKSARKVALAKPVIHFLPEGGVLAAGNYSKIAFKAEAPDGTGIDVKGTITDDAGAEICTFASAHLGIGSFNIVPEAGKSYTANLTYADGTTSVISLPKASITGYTISINNESPDTVRLRITATGTMEKLSLVAQAGGEIFYAAESGPGSKFFTAKISKSKFPSGIVRFTVFNAAGEPLNERLVFINHNDEIELAAKLDTVYATRQKVNIKLGVKDKAGKPATGSFSASVTDETKVPVDEQNETSILTNLLLTSDLKGMVEQPGYYFTAGNKKTTADLDLLMLTQGYRTFAWKQVAYQPEKTLAISGKITKNGKPVPNSKITLFSNSGGTFLIDTLSGADGRFAFNNLVFADSTKFVVQSKIAKGQNSVVLDLDTIMPPAITPARITSGGDKATEQAALTAYTINQEQFIREQQKYGINKHPLMLREVHVEAKKNIVIPHSQNLNGPGNADQVLTAKELERFTCGRISDCLQGVLSGVLFIKHVPYGSSGPLPIMIDGNYVEADIFDDLHVEDIEGIEFIKGPHYGAIYGPRFAGGGLLVTTKRAYKVNNYYRYAPGVITYMPKGYYKARQFYSPQYDNPKTNQRMADLRSTIYWKPDIITDKDGNASFSYFNADGKGTYRVVIEGIDADGNLGRQVYRYKVE